MLLVRTEVKPSPIHGLGCFLLEDVKYSSFPQIWRFNSAIDTIFDLQSIQYLPLFQQEFLRRHGYNEDGLGGILCGDNARYINHSLNPTLMSQGMLDFPTMDLYIGDELTINYHDFGPGLCREFLTKG